MVVAVGVQGGQLMLLKAEEQTGAEGGFSVSRGSYSAVSTLRAESLLVGGTGGRGRGGRGGRGGGDALGAGGAGKEVHFAIKGGEGNRLLLLHTVTVVRILFLLVISFLGLTYVLLSRQ